MDCDFRKFYEEWLELADSLEAVKGGQDEILGRPSRLNPVEEELLERSAEMTDDFRDNFEEYQRSAEEQGCLYDFECLLEAYPKLDSVGYGGGLDMYSDDDE